MLFRIELHDYGQYTEVFNAFDFEMRLIAFSQ